MVLVPWPVKPITLPGTVQLYITPGVLVTVYVAGVPPGAMLAHTLVGPAIGLGTEGLLRVMVRLLKPLGPQSFTACTVTALVVNPVGKAMFTV